MSDATVIVYAKRTPIGNLGGCLANVPAPKLGGKLVEDARTTLNLKPNSVDSIYMGQVLTAGVGQAPARQTALHGGLHHNVCATTLNRVCGSGLKAVMIGDQAIRAGDENISFCGGQENMSLAPHFIPNSRTGFRFGDAILKDHMQYDGLWDPYSDQAMGHFGDLCAEKYGWSREDQDAFAIQSYTKAKQAIEIGAFEEEILPIMVHKKKQTQQIDRDEGPYALDLAKVAGLRPAFNKNGSVTAANASSLNDGAALCVMMRESQANELGLQPLAKIIAQASVAQAPEWFTTAPIACIQKLMHKTKLNTENIDLFEINEAFSCVTMAAIQELQLPRECVNIYGGAVALGHPIGASGTRILVTLIHALRRNNLKRGLATLCIGGGEASGVVIEAI
ncbi:MAG: thiolase family protein [Zetaproteobacteria bacterium]|nr:thiolase family protein [Zetaproteobacteria bacterium]